MKNFDKFFTDKSASRGQGHNREGQKRYPLLTNSHISQKQIFTVVLVLQNYSFLLSQCRQVCNSFGKVSIFAIFLSFLFSRKSTTSIKNVLSMAWNYLESNCWISLFFIINYLQLSWTCIPTNMYYIHMT